MILYHYTYIYIDVNECATNNGGCGHTCTNTVGSYFCNCRTGYTLASDRRICNGKYYINESLDHGNILTLNVRIN